MQERIAKMTKMQEMIVKVKMQENQMSKCKRGQPKDIMDEMQKRAAKGKMQERMAKGRNEKCKKG